MVGVTLRVSVGDLRPAALRAFVLAALRPGLFRPSACLVLLPYGLHFSATLPRRWSISSARSFSGSISSASLILTCGFTSSTRLMDG